MPEAAPLGRSAGSGQGRIVGQISSERVPCGRRRLQHLHYFRVARDSLRMQTAVAHGQHEKRVGEADPNWPEWYAKYKVAEQAGTELPT